MRAAECPVLLLPPAQLLPIKPKVKMKNDEMKSKRSQEGSSSSRPGVLLALLAVSVLIRSVAIQCDNSLEGRLANGGAEEVEAAEEEESRFGGRKPRFDPNQERVVYGTRWQNEIFLPCNILDLKPSHTISWIRLRDARILTVDRLQLTNDARFQLTPSGSNWTMILRQPQDSDAGLYECQVSSMVPKLSRIVELKMRKSRSSLSNLTSLVVRPGDQINLTCTIEAPEVSDFVYWYKNKESIQFDNLKLRLRDQHAKQLQHQHKADYITHRRPARSSRPEAKSAAPPRAIRPSRPTPPSSPTTQRQTELELKEDDFGEEGSSDEADGEQGEKSAGIDLDEKQQQQQQQPQPADKLENDEDDAAAAANGREEEQLQRFTSSLLIKRSQANDTANYTCLPSNAQPSHISVFVVENGAQSQPEKRSLEAVDNGTLSHQRPQQPLMRLIWSLLYSLRGSFPVSENGKPLLGIIYELGQSPDFARVIVTMVMTICTSYITQVGQVMILKQHATD